MSKFPTDEGFEKIIYQDANDLLMQACSGMMTQYMGNDGGVKSAASDVFPRHKLAHFAPPPGKFMLHAVAMGSEEAYGYNKNGDAFSKAALEQNHDTFVKMGHMFREHRNRDPKEAIGQIKASAFNPGLERVELVLWGDCEKAAAEYEAAKKGDPLSFSMSCKVAHDVCSCCGNEAKQAANYCSHLKDNMLQFLPEFQKYAYAKNPNPRFFDMSCVGRPADRIAHSLQYHTGEMAKAASADHVYSGAELAQLEGLHLPGTFSKAVPLSDRRLALLEKMASTEKWMGECIRAQDLQNYKMAFAAQVAPYAFYPDRHLDLQDANIRPGTLFRELAKKACFLSPQSLWSYVHGSTPSSMENADKLSTFLPTLFQGLHKQALEEGGIGNISHCCDADSELNASMDPDYDASIDKLMNKADELFGVGQSLEPRTIEMSVTKCASAMPEAPTETPEASEQTMLDLYGIYKLAAVEHIQELHPGLDEETLCMLAIGQNIQLATAA